MGNKYSEINECLAVMSSQVNHLHIISFWEELDALKGERAALA